MKNTNVVIYARTASLEQEDISEVLEKQVETCRKYCDENNLDALMELREFGNGSASYTPGLAQYLEYVNQNLYDISGIVVIDRTRITRNYQALSKFEEILDKQGCELHIVNEESPSKLIELKFKLKSCS